MPAARDDHAGALVAARDEDEHEVGCGGVEWDVADLIDDQQRNAIQARELLLQATCLLGLAETDYPLVALAKRTR